MMNKGKLPKISFYFENACQRTGKIKDNALVNKVRKFLNKLNPQKMWEEKGIINKKLQVNVYPDFVLILNSKLIACEVEKNYLFDKFTLYDGVEIFDEIWFFTYIPREKRHLHYKFENNLNTKQKFFGVNKTGKIVNIK